MHLTPYPLSRDLVLVGGGHTHALALRSWGMNPLPGARLTLISPTPTAAYSGMLPGHIAGHYPRDALEIDLVQLARFSGARLVIGSADAIDLKQREISVSGRPPITFDLASIDIGITTTMPDLPGFAEHGVAAKPLERFATAWQTYVSKSGPANVAVIGGGVAGAELVLAMSHALGRANRPARLHLVEREEALAALPKHSSQRMRKALAEAGVEVHERAEVIAVTVGSLRLAHDEIEADFVCGAAGARPHSWLADTGLAHREGFITVNSALQSSDPHIFAVGDCADMAFAPRPKAGVYAVRQAPVLVQNLRAALRETGGGRAYHPQKDYLKLISLGGKSALGDRFGLTFAGPWVWRWKNRIDQKFMLKFRNLPRMSPNPLPDERAAGAEALDDKMLCGGCGAKLGQEALMQALGPDGLPGDDAAVFEIGGVRTVISTDHLREIVTDPVTMTRITAQHALGDIWAMGARPRVALTNLILPRMAPSLAARTLGEIMTTAREAMKEAGAQIVGGHSSQGSELTIGFTVTGECDRKPIGLHGARAGDALILTKPIGSGVLMAAEMAGQACGEDVIRALNLMMQSQACAASILKGANAMTDVTGFGLLGHLRNICLNSAVGAELDIQSVPLMHGALELAAVGVRSSLYPDNRLPFPGLDDTPRHDLLIDPQTSGGLLAAVPGEASAMVAALCAAGYEAAEVGRITQETGQIRIC